MPDKNKLKVLEEHYVQQVKTCGTCVNSIFVGSSPWGICSLATYQHGKHTDVKNMPAHLSFVCPLYEVSPLDLQQLGEYSKLVPDY